jgi:hypothetical protein
MVFRLVDLVKKKMVKYGQGLRENLSTGSDDINKGFKHFWPLPSNRIGALPHPLSNGWFQLSNWKSQVKFRVRINNTFRNRNRSPNLFFPTLRLIATFGL